MDTLAQELSELKSFIADLKADRAAQKEKERREAWTKYTSMSLVIIAVLAAIAMQWAGKYSGRVLVALTDSTFNQAKASDQWSYYQAKSIKQNLYELALEHESPLARSAAPERVPTGAPAEPSTQANQLRDKIKRYETDKQQIKAEATGLEQKRDELRATADRATRKGGSMAIAGSIFQISVALGSICLVNKKKSLWYFSMLMALVAVADMVRVWML